MEAVLNAPLEEDEIILSRRLTRAGRSHAYVNDQPVAVSTLKQVGELLVDVHGQRESESLLQPAYQMQLLDAFGGLEAPRKIYLKQAEKVRELRRRFADLSSARQQRRRELALVRFEREELDEAVLAPGKSPRNRASANGWPTPRIYRRLRNRPRGSSMTTTAPL